MKPYMPPTPENYQSVLKDIHARAIQMWAGCIWVPIYEVMTRKHLTVVTLEENLEMAADIGLDATTSLDEAFAAAMERHGPDAKVIVLPYARYQLPANMVRMDAVGDAVSGGGSGALTQRAVPGLDARGTSAEAPESREIKGSTTIVELLRMFPDGEAARLLSQLQMPCAHCGGAFHEPLTMAAKRHRRDPRAVIEAFRALEDAGPSVGAGRRGDQAGRVGGRNVSQARALHRCRRRLHRRSRGRIGTRRRRPARARRLGGQRCAECCRLGCRGRGLRPHR